MHTSIYSNQNKLKKLETKSTKLSLIIDKIFSRSLKKCWRRSKNLNKSSKIMIDCWKSLRLNLEQWRTKKLLANDISKKRIYQEKIGSLRHKMMKILIALSHSQIYKMNWKNYSENSKILRSSFEMHKRNLKIQTVCTLEKELYMIRWRVS